jgi:hypothetical protein
MQQRSLLVCALLFVPAIALTASASNTAEAWLQSHKSPTDDQLGQLQSANPEAFAIVSSLLKKHSTGQLKLSAEERGPDVFRKMMSPKHLSAVAESNQVALPYAVEDAQPAIVDQAHYNPKSASDKDEAMVDRLLGAVAGLAGDKGKKIALLRQRRQSKTEDENPLTKDADLFETAPKPAPVQTLEVPQLEDPAPAPTVAKSDHENSYLKGIDLSGDMPVVAGAKQGVSKPKSEGADLQSFNFDDVVPQKPKPAPKKVAPPQPKKDNAFLKYLGFVNKAPAPTEDKVVPAKPTEKQNPYLVESLLN